MQVLQSYRVQVVYVKLLVVSMELLVVEHNEERVKLLMVMNLLLVVMSYLQLEQNLAFEKVVVRVVKVQYLP